MVISSSATVAPQVEAGQLHAVVQFGETACGVSARHGDRDREWHCESACLSWFGFFGPAGTPKPILDKFYRDVAAAVRDETNHNTLVNKFRVEVPLPTPDELRKMIVKELPFWAKIIRDNNIKIGS